ncbi:MAG: O-antigen ligase family protein [Dehalococcoidia bacterium]|nr:O-antigen ligase family protein [Dehalococcoidia bacterium]
MLTKRPEKVYNDSAMERQDAGVSIYKPALEITWLAVIFLIPLFFNPLSHQACYLNKALLLQFLVMTMLAFWLADWILNRAGCKRLNWQGIFTSPLHLSILVFGLMAVLATAASITPAISFWGSYFRKAGLLTLVCWILFFLILAQQLRTRTQMFRAIYVLLLSSGIVSIVGILQYFFPNILPNLERTGRIFSTPGNALSLSDFLAMVIPFTLALMVYSWNKRKEGNNARILICLAILLSLQLWCLWLAQYSITILLYIIAPIIFIILLGIVKRKRLLLSLGAASLLILAIIAGLLLAPLLLSSPGAETTGDEDFESVSASEEVGLITLDWRVQYWRSAIDIVIKSPEVPFSNDRWHDFRRLIGYGPETFIVTFQLFLPEKMGEPLLSLPLTRPHNHYLYLATTVGLLGLMSFLSILAVFFCLCFRYLRRAATEIDKLLLIAMMAGMAQYMADIFFNPVTISPELVFWLTLSFIPVLGRLTAGDKPEQTRAADSTQPDSSNKPHVNKIRRYVSAGCALLLVLIGFGITIRPLFADMYLHKGLNLQARRNEQAVSAFYKAVELAPGEAVYWHCLGSYDYSVALMIKEGDLQTKLLALATKALERARELEPYIVYRYHVLANVYTHWAKTGAVDKWPIALSLYDKASQLVPDNAIILNKWSLALIVKGDLDEAGTKLDYAASIDPDWAETSFLRGLLLAREGKNAEAASKLTAPIQDNPANLDDFIDLCRRLLIYDMVSPLSDSLEIYTQEAPDDWVAHALIGTTSLFDGNIDKSLDEFNSAMLLVPDDDTGALFRAILKLYNISPKFRTALPDVAAEWRAKLAQSTERDTLLPELDKLLGTQK